MIAREQFLQEQGTIIIIIIGDDDVEISARHEEDASGINIAASDEDAYDDTSADTIVDDPTTLENEDTLLDLEAMC